MKKTVYKFGDLEIQVIIQIINLFWLKFGSILVKITKVQPSFLTQGFMSFKVGFGMVTIFASLSILKGARSCCFR